MNRRKFLQQATASIAATPWLYAADNPDSWELKGVTVIGAANATPREKKAVTVLIEEVEKRTQIRWKTGSAGAENGQFVIYAGTRSSLRGNRRVSSAIAAAQSLKAEGYAIRSGSDSGGRWIAIVGADERGLLFGVGKLLQTLNLSRQAASVNTRSLNIATSPKYPLRGHQLGYRPKTNAYDAWNVATWDQYIRDMAMFGTNAIELMPPRTDDLPDSPHFPLPPEQMMVEMSRIADDYGLDLWIWYPAMDPNYADPATVESALKEWAHIYQILPRIDAVFVPGGDPGHTEPNAMLAFLEKQKTSLRRFHPKAQMWVSPQGFRGAWMDDFFKILDQQHTATWLDGVVYGPQNRLTLPDLRKRVPKNYPIRFYPDITHSVECQYPVPDWDVAYALTEGREVINPRPEDEANILRRYSPYTVGFITYSEGCNDDVNKFVWSALGWDPDMHVTEALRNFGRYFLGETYADGFAQGLMSLEKNWRGPLATNESVAVTLSQFQDLERSATPAVLESWRFQQALYRAYYDAAVRARLLEENGRLRRAYDVLARVEEIGWTPVPLGIGNRPSPAPPNGLDPGTLLDEADRILLEAAISPGAAQLRARVLELGETLLQSIQMQLAVDRYQAEAVNRAANLDTLDYPVSDIPWLRGQIAEIRKLASANEQVAAIKNVLNRTNPGPGGFYDDLGNPSNRPHLLLGPGYVEDPEFRTSVLTGFSYPDHYGKTVPIAWKRWAETLFDTQMKMRYADLDPDAQYRLRVVYTGDARNVKIQLTANGKHEIHPLMARPMPPKPLEFDIPSEAIVNGTLDLAWNREPGLGGNGRGCQVSEVWIIRK